MREKESWLHKLLTWLKIIGPYEVSKKDMCINARNTCNRKCDSCAWKEDD